jgi:glutathione S-transferase
MSDSTSYQLFLSQRSPFARRIRLALDRLGLPFEAVFVDVFDANNPSLRLNPLGMVPVLRTPEGDNWFDSSVILEQLHDRTGQIWPFDPTERAQVRQASALAAGIMQAAVSLFQERSMHEPPSNFWIADHTETLERALQSISSFAEKVWVSNGELTQAGWDLAVAEEYLAFRAPEIRRPESNEGGRRKGGDIAALASQSVVFRESKPRAN